METFRVGSSWGISLRLIVLIASMLGQLNVHAADTAGAGDSDTQSDQSRREKKPELEEIVVTGTFIRDIEPITPVTTITSTDIEHQGYSTLSGLIEQRPENFKAGSSEESNPVNAIGNSAANNYSFASGINLRGLGANATLVLLNGQRLAPTALGGVVDISSIPISIVDRVEMLPDGASALYGSDAVAGVVNIITKTAYSGVQVDARTFSISDGKAPNYAGGVLAGTSWNGGNAMGDFYYEKDNELLAANRSFAESLPHPTTLFPEGEKYSYFAAMNQEFTEHLSLAANSLITHRIYDESTLLSIFKAPTKNDGGDDQYNLMAQLDYKISKDWLATLIAQGSKEEDVSNITYPDLDRRYRSHYDYRILTLEPRVDGKLFDLPGGPVGLAVGAQFRSERYDETDQATGSAGIEGPLIVTPPVVGLSRSIASAYGELALPIIGKSNSLPFTQELRVDISVRFDHYSDFGSTTNPKIGISWTPLQGLRAYASFGRSFQAPTLYEISNALSFGYEATVPDPRSPTGSSLTFSIDGTNPNLKPETSKNFYGGLTFSPRNVEGLKVDASYFYVNFTNQIKRLIEDGFFPQTVLQNENQLGSFITRNPSAAQIEQALAYPGRETLDLDNGFCVVGTAGCPGANPASFASIANIGYVNSSTVKAGGVDLSAQYLSPAQTYGRIRSDVVGTFFTTYQQMLTPASMDFSPLNTVYHPLRFRVKANLGWESRGWRANARLNYSNSYENTNAVNPNCPGASNCGIASWTTMDFSLGYQTASNVKVGLDVTNAFDRAPPHVSGPIGTYPYDPVNASALMRAFAVSISKKW
jgi:outer membrane receptor protein involved in Fe transport